MKKFTVVLTLAALGLGLATSSLRASDAKSYQVTGPVLEVSASYIVVKKGEQNWQIALDKSTKGANVKVGDKVTVYYTMTATEIEPKAPKTPKADKP
jgi:ABC-type bacteriocin/lantibiotic exporter with double-glycine peptidase domain